MQIVNLPDGTQLRFPDNMSEDDINAALDKLSYDDLNKPSVPAAAPSAEPAYNPTEGMSWTEKAAAGFGKALYDTARGTKLAGLRLADVLTGGERAADYRKELDELRAADEALLGTPAGAIGNIAGSIAQLVGPGAALGAAGKAANAAKLVDLGRALASPTTYKGAMLTGGALAGVQPTDTGIGNFGNATLGALTGGLGVAAPRVLTSAWQGAKALVDPLTEAGRERVVARTLNRFARDPSRISAATGEIVPGSSPTLAEATMDPGLAVLEKIAQNADPQLHADLVERYVQNNAARLKMLETGVLDEAAYDLADMARRADAKKYSKALEKSTGAVDTSRVVGMIDNVVAKNAKRSELTEPLLKVRDSLFDDTGALVDNPQVLRSASDAIGDMLRKKGPTGVPVHEFAAKELTTVKRALDRKIGQAAPEFKKFQEEYKKASRPLNQSDAMAAIRDAVAPPSSGVDKLGNRTIRPGAVETAADNLDRLVAKGVGFKRAKAERVLSDEQKTALDLLRRDVQRSNAASKLSRVSGSDTGRNLIGQNLLEQTLGPLGIPVPKSGPLSTLADVARNASSAIDFAYRLGDSNERVARLLSGAVTDAKEAKRILASLTPPQRGAVMQALSATGAGVSRALPATGLGVLVSPE